MIRFFTWETYKTWAVVKHERNNCLTILNAPRVNTLCRRLATFLCGDLTKRGKIILAAEVNRSSLDDPAHQVGAVNRVALLDLKG